MADQAVVEPQPRKELKYNFICGLCTWIDFDPIHFDAAFQQFCNLFGGETKRPLEWISFGLDDHNKLTALWHTDKSKDAIAMFVYNEKYFSLTCGERIVKPTFESLGTGSTKEKKIQEILKDHREYPAELKKQRNVPFRNPKLDRAPEDVVEETPEEKVGKYRAMLKEVAARKDLENYAKIRLLTEEFPKYKVAELKRDLATEVKRVLSSYKMKHAKSVWRVKFTSEQIEDIKLNGLFVYGPPRLGKTSWVEHIIVEECGLVPFVYSGKGVKPWYGFDVEVHTCVLIDENECLVTMGKDGECLSEAFLKLFLDGEHPRLVFDTKYSRDGVVIPPGVPIFIIGNESLKVVLGNAGIDTSENSPIGLRIDARELHITKALSSAVDSKKYKKFVPPTEVIDLDTPSSSSKRSREEEEEKEKEPTTTTSKRLKDDDNLPPSVQAKKPAAPVIKKTGIVAALVTKAKPTSVVVAKKATVVKVSTSQKK
jgi:hypothetical protein